MKLDRVIEKINSTILKEINDDIIYKTHYCATTLLADVFRSFFNIEKSVELAEPSIYTFDQDPDQILLQKLDEFQLDNIPLFIHNDEVLIRKFKRISDLDLILVVDGSASMLYRWGIYNENDSYSQIKESKWYAEKFLCSAFAKAANMQNITTKLILFDEDVCREFTCSKNKTTIDNMLFEIDEHFLLLFKQMLNENVMKEKTGLVNALKRVEEIHKRSFVIVVSDFLDDLAPSIPHLRSVNQQHSLTVVCINDYYEKRLPRIKWYQPYVKTWEHGKDIEKNYNERILLNNSMINKYNNESRKRLRKVRDGFSKYAISSIEIQAGPSMDLQAHLQELGRIIEIGY